LKFELEFEDLKKNDYKIIQAEDAYRAVRALTKFSGGPTDFVFGSTEE
jgi:hypothetical protein